MFCIEPSRRSKPRRAGARLWCGLLRHDGVLWLANYWTARTEKPWNRLKSYAGLTPSELKYKK